jgi:hypothetical protein
VFLHCLALKRAFGAGDTLVVWVPTCPETIYNVNVSSAVAFYRGCHARRLDGIPFMRKSNSVEMSLDQMRTFAETKGKKVLIIIDQMNRKLKVFDSLKQCLKDYVLDFNGRGHRVILASSTSGTATPIFGEAFQDLRPLDHFLSSTEIDLVKGQHPDSNNLNLLANSEWSFLNATSILLGTAINLERMASEFFDSLIRQFNIDNFETAMSRKAEYARVLYMSAVKKESATDLCFDSALVDGDKFFVKKQEDNTYVIREFMQGFARLVLDKMKRRSDYGEFLRYVIDLEKFRWVTEGAQGSILEDAASCNARPTPSNSRSPI